VDSSIPAALGTYAKSSNVSPPLQINEKENDDPKVLKRVRGSDLMRMENSEWEEEKYGKSGLINFVESTENDDRSGNINQLLSNIPINMKHMERNVEVQELPHSEVFNLTSDVSVLKDVNKKMEGNDIGKKSSDDNATFNAKNSLSDKNTTKHDRISRFILPILFLFWTCFLGRKSQALKYYLPLLLIVSSIRISLIYRRKLV
jgi:hypothetical protein